MREQPVNRISEKGLKVWRLYGIMQTGILVYLSAIGAGVLAYIFEGPWWIYAVACGCCHSICVLIHLLISESKMDALAL